MLTRLQLLAGNPFSDIGGDYLAEKLCASNFSLRVRTSFLFCFGLMYVKVLDIHNSDMTPENEERLVEYFNNNSSLHLLGSHFGRRDHRINRIAGDLNRVRGHFLNR